MLWYFFALTQTFSNLPQHTVLQLSGVVHNIRSWYTELYGCSGSSHIFSNPFRVFVELDELTLYCIYDYERVSFFLYVYSRKRLVYTHTGLRLASSPDGTKKLVKTPRQRCIAAVQQCYTRQKQSSEAFLGLSWFSIKIVIVVRWKMDLSWLGFTPKFLPFCELDVIWHDVMCVLLWGNIKKMLVH